MASQSDAVRWYYANVIGRHNTYSHGPGGLGGRFLKKADGNITTDCSGSTWAAYKEACGLNIGMNCGDLALNTGKWVDGPSNNAHTPDISKLAPGDLLLFRGGTAGRPWGSSHVEMYLGDGKCAGCGSTKIVKPGSCTSAYWSNKYIGAKRVLENGAEVGGNVDPASAGAWEGSYSADGSMMAGGGYRIGECPEDIQFKKLWNMYREKSYDPTLGGVMDGSFAGGVYGAGNLPIPNDFPSDSAVKYYISHCEGDIVVKWSKAGPAGPPCTDNGQFGYDGVGGVHSGQILKTIGVTVSDILGGKKDSDITWKFYRKPIGGERGDAYTAVPPIHGSEEYWAKLIPYYRDQIIEAWISPPLQSVSNLGLRYAMCHFFNWGKYKGYKGIMSLRGESAIMAKIPSPWNTTTTRNGGLMNQWMKQFPR